ncbi:MAG: 5'/3'-nucleotidase SurE [Cyanobacteria bacterium J06628_6]
MTDGITGGMIVLTNDDGFGAPGIHALQAALKLAFPDLTSAIVAPDQHLSGCSHQLNRGGPITIDQRGEHAYAIGGTPADCTRVAVSHLYPNVQWVLSGINAGGNLGADIYVSGTVAAVREAALLRVPGIAMSHYIHQRQPVDWRQAAERAAAVLAKFMATPLEAGEFWNINLPHGDVAAAPEMVVCRSCTQPLPTEYVVENNEFRYVGRYRDRKRDPGADTETCLNGHISAVKIRLW